MNPLHVGYTELDLKATAQTYSSLGQPRPPVPGPDQFRSRVERADPVEPLSAPLSFCRDQHDVDVAGHAGPVIGVRPDNGDSLNVWLSGRPRGHTRDHPGSLAAPALQTTTSDLMTKPSRAHVRPVCQVCTTRSWVTAMIGTDVSHGTALCSWSGPTGHQLFRNRDRVNALSSRNDPDR